MKIGFVIPIHNEGAAIGSLITDLVERGCDVFVIDDGSTDGSGQKASVAGAIVLRNDEKKGKGYSLRRGFDVLLKKGYEGVITMDGDGQHAVCDADEFMAKASTMGPCVIVGNRMEKHQEMPFFRLLTNRCMSFCISLAAHQKIPDTQCGYRFIHAQVLKEITLTSCSFEIETEILMKASKKGFAICSVPIKTIYGKEESKINPLKDSVRFIIYFIKELLN